jgi:hypothetical protein
MIILKLNLKNGKNNDYFEIEFKKKDFELFFINI